MTLAERLTNEVIKDKYFIDLFQKAERVAAYDLLLSNHDETITQKEYLDLMRFSDILSHSSNSDARNSSYKIVTLLVKEFGETDDFKIFAGAILAKLGNFPALKFLQDYYKYVDVLPLEREIEKRIKTELQRTTDGKNIFTDAQYQIRKDVELYDYFSFSGPTSLGKSFILKDFIRHLLNDSGLVNEGSVVVLVPTRALISQVMSDIRSEVNNKKVNIAAHPTLSTYALRKYKQHIFVFTPERLLSYVSVDNPSIKYLFVDEAQKIITVNDPRSSLYYHAVYETTRRFATKIIFASPNIPNPDIFLKLFEKDNRGSLHVNEQTVAQNRYFINCFKKEASFFSEFGSEQKLIDFQLNTNPKELIKDIGSEVKNIIYCNGISETVKRAKEFAESLEYVKDEEINKLVTFVSEYVHKDYYLVECLKKGVAFHHGRMPQRIRRKVEDLFSNKDSQLKYIFCTSTLLEGVNLPAKNIFIFNDNHGSHIFEKIDFENLVGRAGRLTKEFSGNVICIKDDPRRWKHGASLLEKTKLENIDSFMINTEKRRTKEFINIGKSLLNSPLSSGLRVGEQENINHYASIVLLHHIENEGSLLKAGFLEKNKEALNILQKLQKINNVPSNILKLSSTIKPLYQNRVLDYISKNSENAVLNINLEDNEIIVKALNVLYVLYNWGQEESNGRDYLIPPGLVKKGYGQSVLKYWAMLLRNWTKSEPLNRLISFSIKYYSERGNIWFHEDGMPKNEAFTGSQKQINVIIEQIMSDIENGLRFKIEKYFRNYYLLACYVLGKEKAGQDWSEFIEYGTSDKRMIELQRLGFSRGASKYLLTKHAPEFSFNENNLLVEINDEKLLSKFDKKNEYYEDVKEIFG